MILVRNSSWVAEYLGYQAPPTKIFCEDIMPDDGINDRNNGNKSLDVKLTLLKLTMTTTGKTLERNNSPAMDLLPFNENRNACW